MLLKSLLWPNTAEVGKGRMKWLGVPQRMNVPLSASERQSGWVLPGGSGRNRSSGTSIHFTPVVYTCGVFVLQELRRTKAVLGGLYGVVSTQKVGSEKAG